MTGWQSEQIRRNRRTRDCWARYAAHRARVTELLVGPPAEVQSGDRQLGLLGFGNGNDVDLQRLAEHFSRILLVDLDSAAVEAGWARQQPFSAEVLQIGGDVDCSGILEWIGAWCGGTLPADQEVAACLAAAAAAPLPALLRNLDGIGSLCLLSQILEAAHQALGPQHPSLLPLIRVLRQRHLEQLVAALRPGGRGLILIDFVSSETCPELATVAEAELADLAKELLRQRNFFTGLNPLVLWQQLQQPPFAAQVRAVQLSAPWRWHFPARTYAVCGLQFVKQP